MAGSTARAPALTPAQAAGLIADVVAPLLARGIIIRRPGVVNVLDRLDADRRAVRRMQSIRAAHGPGPARLTLPGRQLALVLEPSDVHRVLRETPDPFATANAEKVAALAHFEPHGVLISQGEERRTRRRFNERVLDSARPVHELAAGLIAKVRQEARQTLTAARARGTLGWDEFATGWWRMVRRVTLGDAARDDHELTELLAELRADANWSFAKPRRDAVRERFFERLRVHLEHAERGSLAELVAGAPDDPSVARDEQVPQWLFAFDAAGMASLRALAVLCAQPRQLARAQDEIAGRDLDAPAELPFLRACVLESVRLWPTTPAILRDTTAETVWASGPLPAGTGVLVFVPFFHRDDTRLPYADRFEPELWLGDAPADDWPLIPFSGGPGECPGRNLVLLLTSTWLATVLSETGLRLRTTSRLDGADPLPATLSPFRLRFEPLEGARVTRGAVAAGRSASGA